MQDMSQNKTNWGGKRKGAGRPKSANPKILWAVKVTPEEREYLKQKLVNFRQNT